MREVGQRYSGLGEYPCPATAGKLRPLRHAGGLLADAGRGVGTEVFLAGYSRPRAARSTFGAVLCRYGEHEYAEVRVAGFPVACAAELLPREEVY